MLSSFRNTYKPYFLISCCLLTLMFYPIKQLLSSTIHLAQQIKPLCFLALKFLILLIIIEASIVDCTIIMWWNFICKNNVRFCCLTIIALNLLHSHSGYPIYYFFYPKRLLIRWLCSPDLIISQLHLNDILFLFCD